MAKLKSVRLKQSEIQLIISKLKRSEKNEQLIEKLWQAPKTSGEKIDDTEFKRLKERDNTTIQIASTKLNGANYASKNSEF